MVKCENLDEVRAAIDRLDTEIVRLICERGAYVAEAGRLKSNRDQVVVPERIEAIVTRVRAMAKSEDFDADTVERIYRAMIDAYIAFEHQAFDDKG
jgi:isochorismate pyruvate lyase